MDEARRQLIARRTREAIASRKRAGTYGHRPFLDRATVEAIVGLHRRGWSLRQIATQLTREGRPTARGGPWDHSTIRKVIIREASRP